MTAPEPLASVEHLSRKFCRSFKRSVLYTGIDLARNAVGLASHDGLRAQEYLGLDDVSLELRAGECLGLIGENGAGKSTLLKILAGIIEPSRGTATVRGRVGSLIEVGAGFHPDLTGRDNIYLNGAILGLSTREVRERFDSIVDFAAIGDHIDSPVRFYSSGMHVRLGFAIAAHVQPAILLIDEVLAVGDLAFSMKCLAFLRNYLRGGGAAILVSHDLVAIHAHCGRVVHLARGRIVAEGRAAEVIEGYRRSLATPDHALKNEIEHPDFTIGELAFRHHNAESTQGLKPGHPLTVTANYEAKAPFEDLVFNLALHEASGNQVCAFRTDASFGERTVAVTPGAGALSLHIEQLNLQPGLYRFSLRVWSGGHAGVLLACKEQAWPLVVEGGASVAGVCYVPARWSREPPAQ
ncbi:MAG: ABC transporter ATP-binding protein [Myxococcales bacterium]|nr:ABC transporter ATP-binding protein [Myxococcales bacterium]